MSDYSDAPEPAVAATPLAPDRAAEARLVRRILPLIKQFLDAPQAYPTINSPRSGSVFDGGQVVPVEMTSNKDITHELRLIPANGPGTSQQVMLSSTASVTAQQAMPPSSGNTDDYFLEVQAPSGGPAHRIVISVRPAITATASDNVNGTPTLGVEFTVTVVPVGAFPEYDITWTFRRDHSTRRTGAVTFGAPYEQKATFAVSDTYRLDLTIIDSAHTADAVTILDIAHWTV